MIQVHMEEDALNLENQPFNARVVGEYFGKQGAAIAALAKAISLIVENKE